ncbi:single-stranded DNA-binding protein [Clostridium sp. A1-XYC3]|uniref:Single-stranded DNA-binding protein n=1 Tax=Clostridium tanneri TaxID=3037988 RepID=A0ABU4JNI4_9CLOT|nr:single-stranded DNA-binding protein [Clostridium sp. A1-XYC3]MDW8799675.1 single-stranded DNA-binding protein [Clostridium sp. A1-XYC3]
MNKVVLIGRLTKDAELMQLEGKERGVLRFTLAVDRRFSNNSGGKEADFIPVRYWSDFGHKIQPYLLKGKLIGVSGKVSTRSYTTDESAKRYVTEIEADNIQFLERKKEDIV